MNDLKLSNTLNLEVLQISKEYEEKDNEYISQTLSVKSKLRMDKFGNIISKNNKNKHKVTFIDRIDKNKKLVEVHQIESYKIYNSMEQEKCKLNIFNVFSKINI